MIKATASRRGLLIANIAIAATSRTRTTPRLALISIFVWDLLSTLRVGLRAPSPPRLRRIRPPPEGMEATCWNDCQHCAAHLKVVNDPSACSASSSSPPPSHARRPRGPNEHSLTSVVEWYHCHRFVCKHINESRSAAVRL